MADASEPADAVPIAAPVLHAEVVRRVGRNVLLYQHIENALKELLFYSLIEGTPADRQRRMAKRAAKVARMNLGDVSKAVFEEVLAAAPRERAAPADLQEPWIRMRFTIAPPADWSNAFEPLRSRCKAIVDRRNDLVHHFLRQWQSETDSNLLAACEALDAQHDAADAFRDEVAALLRAQEELRKKAAADFASPEFGDKLKDALAQGNVIAVLVDVAASERRRDGWTLLTTAQHRLRERVPADLARLKERLGRDWLFRTMAQSPESFEAITEPLPNGPAGATRIVYRVLDVAPGATASQ